MNISLRRSITWAWKIYKDNPIFYVGIVLTFFASWVLLELIVIKGYGLGTIFNLAIHITFLIAFSGMQVGFIKICLDVKAGNNPHYAELFNSINQGAKFFVAQLAYFVIVSIGLLLLVIPGVYLGGRYGFFTFDMVEKNSGITESFQASATLMNGSTGKIAYYLFLLLLLNIFGALFIGLGLLITVPVSALTMASLYQEWKSKSEAINPRQSV
jgi:hypothetical protein